MRWFDWLLIAAVVALVVCPPRYDPAIRLKEWLRRDKP
jgi:Sec-independent protein translocase protein TatA